MSATATLPPFDRPNLRNQGDIVRWMARPWSAWAEQPLVAPSGFPAPECVHRVTMNNRYMVQVSSVMTGWGLVDHLWIRRHDAEPIRAWGVVQRIKREVLTDGADRVGVEVYPRDADVVDLANLYHLWVMPVGFELPFALGVRGRE